MINTLIFTGALALGPWDGIFTWCALVALVMVAISFFLFWENRPVRVEPSRELPGGQGTPGVQDASRLDEVDREILSLVATDLAIFDSEIAARLGLTRQAVNARRRALEKAGYRVRVR